MLRIAAFVCATLLAMGILVVAGATDDSGGPKVGWFDVTGR